MIRFLLINVLIFTTATLHSQVRIPIANHATERSVFDDAVELYNIYGSNTAPDIESRKEILKNYFNSLKEINDFNNSYSLKIPSNGLSDAGVGLTGRNPKISKVQNETSKRVTGTIINEAGIFIAERFKKEINVAFLEKFRKQLDSLPYLGAFFPLSKKLLINSDPYNYPVFIAALKEAFTTDINNLVTDYPVILENLDTKDPKINYIIKTLAKLLQSKNFHSFRNALNQIAQENHVSDISLPLYKHLGITVFALNALSTLEGDNITLNETNLQQLKNIKLFEIYLSLLVRQNEEYLERNKLLNKWNGQQLQNIQIIIEKIAVNFQTVNNQIEQTGDLVPGSPAYPQGVTKIVQLTISAIKRTLESNKTSDYFGINNDTNEIVLFLNSAAAFNETILFIQTKQYGLALTNITNFIIELPNSKFTAGQKVMIKKYGSFISAMITAKEGEALEALDNAANPVGSYRIKRNSTFNIAFNAFAGGFYGSDFKGNAVYGFTAPVGIYVGWGNFLKKKPILANDDGKSVGLFISMIDLGSVASFRLQDKETEMAEVTWDNIFSPGAYISVGLGKCPISLNLGGQVGPELKSVNANGSITLKEKEWYWRAGITVDISLFDFYIKQREYKVKTCKSNRQIPSPAIEETMFSKFKS